MKKINLPLFSLLLLFLNCFYFSSFAQKKLPAFPRPCGIYILGGGMPDKHLDNIRDSPFVDGYTLRVSWAELETAKKIYNFKIIDSAIGKLQPLNQKLTILLNIVSVPDYILKLRNVQTFINDGDTTVLPWDNASTPYLNAFLDTLSKFRVKNGNKKVALKDHPTFKQVETPIKGIGKLRDPLVMVGSLPGYNRKLFTNVCVQQIQQYMNDFPKQFKYIPFFNNITDSITNPPLADTLRWVFNKKFNSNLSAPTLGYFQEDLACSTPNISYGAPEYKSRDTTYNMFQMLQGWMCPFSNPAKTDPCKTDTSGPDVAMRYAIDTFYATYFEVYPCDVDWSGYSKLFRHWHDTLNSLCGSRIGTHKLMTAAQDKFIIYPNPMNDVSVLKIIPANGKLTANYELCIYNMYGKEMKRYNISSTLTSILRKDLPSGLYFYYIKNKEQIVYKGNLAVN